MADATCKTCPMFVPIKLAEVGAAEGTCHLLPSKPVAFDPEDGGKRITHENPIVSPHWFCGEHPLRQRDRLAAMAMQGLMSADWCQDTMPGELAELAYSQADAMLAQRAKESQS